MIKKFILGLALAALPAIVFADDINRKENASAQQCASFSLICSSPPCFPWGANGKDFSGTTNQYYVTINLESGTLSVELEGRAKNAGSYFPVSTYTTGFDGYLLRKPPNLRLVINDGAVGTGVICGNS